MSHCTRAMEAQLLAGLAHRQLGDQRAASQAAERALALAESDRLILPFAMTGSAGLLEALPRHQTAHAALLADILDVLHGSSCRRRPHARATGSYAWPWWKRPGRPGAPRPAPAPGSARRARWRAARALPRARLRSPSFVTGRFRQLPYLRLRRSGGPVLARR